MKSSWPAEILGLILLFSGAVVAGLALGGLAWFLLLAASLYLARHLWHLWRLERWLRNGRRRIPPEGSGIWSDVFEHYYRLQKRYYKRKKRLSRVIREFRESTSAMPDGSVVLDPEWRIVWFNAAAEQLLRLNGNQDRGQIIMNLIRSPRFSDHVRAGDFSRPCEITSPASPDRYLSLLVVPYGENQRLLLIRDITRVKRLEAMRRDFVANASHELRSPLTVLAGYVESLQDDPVVAREWTGPLTEMQRQARRMTSLINDLLELSRLETEEQEAPREQSLEVDRLAGRVVEEARMLSQGPREIEVLSQAPERLLGVERELYSALSNLVFNALRHTQEGGRISITWRCDDKGRRVLEVEDDGEGIEARHIPFLTQRFYRADPARNRHTGGTGLGLAIVKHVLQRHGGRLEIESVLGQGSIFRCVFPDDRVEMPQDRLIPGSNPVN